MPRQTRMENPMKNKMRAATVAAAMLFTLATEGAASAHSAHCDFGYINGSVSAAGWVVCDTGIHAARVTFQSNIGTRVTITGAYVVAGHRSTATKTGSWTVRWRVYNIVPLHAG